MSIELLARNEENNPNRATKNEPSHQLHNSFLEFEQAATGGCDFCGLVLECFQRTPLTRRKGDLWPRNQTVAKGEPGTMYDMAKVYNLPDKIRLESSHELYHKTIEATCVWDLLPVRTAPTDMIPLLELTISAHESRQPTLGKFRIGRLPIETDLGSARTHAVARKWLSECQRSHDKCSSSRLPLLPRRVIDVGTSSQRSRLVMYQNKRAPYVALSHCWGGNIPTKLVRETLIPFGRELPPLPANFEDAITITRELGICYLWIDCLCIIKDSLEDWSVESAKMGELYRSSTVTLFALSSKASTNRIPKSTPCPTYSFGSALIRVFDDERNTDTVRVKHNTQDNDRDLRSAETASTLTKRGWVMQETILAHHQLCYSTSQIFWTCPEKFRAMNGICAPVLSHEVWPVTMRVLHEKRLRHDSIDEIEKKAFLLEYYELVRAYSHRNLTFAADLLPAFTGITVILDVVIPGKYLAGLWSEDLHRGLFWATSEATQPLQYYRGPSWSWVASKLPDPTTFDLKLLNHDITPRRSGNFFGEIKAASLTVEAFTMPISSSAE
ncbi:HET-domain-containing protein, partial [Sporormia fimetaria CBS 119925]